jgi:hypothetical protein
MPQCSTPPILKNDLQDFYLGLLKANNDILAPDCRIKMFDASRNCLEIALSYLVKLGAVEIKDDCAHITEKGTLCQPYPSTCTCVGLLAGHCL